MLEELASRPFDPADGAPTALYTTEYAAGAGRLTRLVLARQWLLNQRDRSFYVARTLQAVILGLVGGRAGGPGGMGQRGVNCALPLHAGRALHPPTFPPLPLAQIIASLFATIDPSDPADGRQVRRLPSDLPRQLQSSVAPLRRNVALPLPCPPPYLLSLPSPLPHARRSWPWPPCRRSRWP